MVCSTFCLWYSLLVVLCVALLSEQYWPHRMSQEVLPVPSFYFLGQTEKDWYEFLRRIGMNSWWNSPVKLSGPGLLWEVFLFYLEQFQGHSKTEQKVQSSHIPSAPCLPQTLWTTSILQQRGTFVTMNLHWHIFIVQCLYLTLGFTLGVRRFLVDLISLVLQVCSYFLFLFQSVLVIFVCLGIYPFHRGYLICWCTIVPFLFI